MPDGDGHAPPGACDSVCDGVVHGFVRDHFAAFAERMQEGGHSLVRSAVRLCRVGRSLLIEAEALGEHRREAEGRHLPEPHAREREADAPGEQAQER